MTAPPTTRAGFVSLVGAGPGDPELLTRAALRRLRQADLVLHDALVPAAIVGLARRARRFYVGKRAGRPSIPQDAINRLLVREARRGRRVVRLKAGDPFVLGRGGEEALALRAAGVPFEVVPGVTSALAAPALAGIPVTHRGIASGFVVLSAHAEDAYAPVVDALPPNRVTVVVLMGLAAAGALASRLIARGWQRATPAAVLFAASTPDATTWRGPLADLAQAAADAPDGAPGTIVIGEVVNLAAVLGHAAAPALRSAGVRS
jgi:uroporphyrin-III C-methyltransferase / precorrin-2 dehydrogenase / sirohydrochlorin ferrochelatase